MFAVALARFLTLPIHPRAGRPHPRGSGALLPAFVSAGSGRVACVILGTFDYTASCNIASTFQSHMHPAADFARQMMLANLMGTDVALSDGITNIMPIPPNKGEGLTEEQINALPPMKATDPAPSDVDRPRGGLKRRQRGRGG